MMKTKADMTAPRNLHKPKSRQQALVAAASSVTATIPEVMDQLPARSSDGEITAKEKIILESIAHGAEGYGNEYGSGPSAANAEARKEPSRVQATDSASPAAAALGARRNVVAPAASVNSSAPERKVK